MNMIFKKKTTSVWFHNIIILFKTYPIVELDILQ